MRSRFFTLLLCAAMANAPLAQAQFPGDFHERGGAVEVSVGMVIPLGGSRTEQDRALHNQPRLELRSGWTARPGLASDPFARVDASPALTVRPLALSLDAQPSLYAFDQSVARMEHGRWTLDPQLQTGPACDAAASACLSPAAKWAARGALVAGVLVLTGLTLVALGDGSY